MLIPGLRFIARLKVDKVIQRNVLLQYLITYSGFPFSTL